ncbi:uncharacterized protein LOC126373663 [Pectinophora gossypiella]|nr:uncharacterized protein LOC126373663 [Pectinophora gossypiella]
MEGKPFFWTPELVKRLIQLRFENDWLFKKRKQPWSEFHKILLENGFPHKMTVKHVSKKWSYMCDTYKIAKRDRNKSWKYYKAFDKHYGKMKVLDKYESWNDEWRLKLITCITEAKALKLDYQNMWWTVERALRCQDLPTDCCIQDIKGLWSHLRTTFSRKHRMKLRKGALIPEWALYAAMLEYYQAFEAEHLEALRGSAAVSESRRRRASKHYLQKKTVEGGDDEYEFQWTKDITETFIQIRLQNDWLFRERKWAWNDLVAIMVEEYGFPKMLTGREISRKWSSTFSEYQKAKATGNKSWVYYTLFELYLGEGSLSLNPVVGWQEEWVSNLISARIDLDYLFVVSYKERNDGWREVERRLRNIGLPLDHSLLDLPEIWTYLIKTYKWKRKFADKGMLSEQWPYFEAMAQYEKAHQPKQKQELEYDCNNDDCNDDNDFDDDIKLFDLKQKLELQVKPKLEYLEANQCRSCSNDEGCVNIFDQKDDDGLDLAHKLRIVGDVQVEPSDSLPSQICLNCVRELENAFKFRRKCQEVDKEFRNPTDSHKIKVEGHLDDNDHDAKDDPDRLDDDSHFDDIQKFSETKEKKPKIKKEPPKIMKKKKKVRKDKYEYMKICEICGKYTKNLMSHLDMHSSGKAYSCDVCDKKFKFKSGLIIHKASHDPTPRKTCEVCGKTFHILAQYRRHFVYHANERKYECETCGKRFNTLDILKVHNRTHTDERPFPCPECGKTFRTAGCVSRHKRIVHRTIKNQ